MRVEKVQAALQTLMDTLGIDLGAGELRWVSPAQAALLDFCREHPFATIHDLVVQNGDPMIANHVLDAAVSEKCRFVRDRT